MSKKHVAEIQNGKLAWERVETLLGETWEWVGQELEPRNLDSTLHFEISDIRDFVIVLPLTQQKLFMNKKMFSRHLYYKRKEMQEMV